MEHKKKKKNMVGFGTWPDVYFIGYLAIGVTPWLQTHRSGSPHAKSWDLISPTRCQGAGANSRFIDQFADSHRDFMGFWGYPTSRQTYFAIGVLRVFYFQKRTSAINVL